MNESALTITTPTATYPIFVGSGLLKTLPDQLAPLGLGGALWLISDSEVYPRYGPAVEAALRAAGYSVQSHSVLAGEASKDLSIVAGCYDWLIGGKVERRDAVLALGGGVVGDLAGFVAATVLRGIAVIQLPTTLLAMVDSAIGGKTGVNHPLGKNLIGAFHQPRLVLSDTNTLATLPPRELQAGWAEVIKHGVIRDAGLFEMLELVASRKPQVASSAIVGEAAATRDLRPAATAPLMIEPDLSNLIRTAAKVKVDVVNADERESGERMLLNYGHTLGQALEAATSYGELLHGEAVAIGMTLAARIAERLGMFDAASVERQTQLLRAYGLPTELPPGVAPNQLLDLTLQDKKVRAGKPRWVLPTAIGAAIVRDDVPEELVRAVVEGA